MDVPTSSAEASAWSQKLYLNSDRIRRKSPEVDGVHVEVRDIDNLVQTGFKTGSRSGFRPVGGEDGKEALLEGDEGEPEHGADEEVHKVLDLEKNSASSRSIITFFLPKLILLSLFHPRQPS